jgi:glutamate decarboxylase
MANEQDWTIEKVREFFINPRTGDEAVNLGVTASYVLAGMGMIYGSHRNQELPERFLSGLGDGPLGLVVAQLLRNESRTRRFDEKFMGQIHPQGNMVAILAKVVGGYMNTNTIVQEVSPSEHDMEYFVLDWLAKLVGYDHDKYSGNLVSGGSTANLAGLWVAREKLIRKLRTQEGDDYRIRAKIVVLGSDMKHYSIEKGSRILGENIEYQKVDSRNFKVDIQAMRDALQSCAEQGVPVMAIVGIAGETETGMVEDLTGLANLAHEYGVHFHVDAAYGGPYVLTDPTRFAGIELADSVTIDPHKMLYTPCSS